MLIGGSFASIPLPFNNCVVPSGINGPVAIYITSDGQPLLNNVIDRATTQLVAGPTMAFIDTQPQALGQLARSGGSANSGSSSGSASATISTATISPAEASAIISSAGSTTAAATASSSTSSSVSGSTNAVALSPSTPSVAGSPNTYVGPSADGTMDILGWSTVPNPNASSAAAASVASGTASSSSGSGY